jgi:hypothetical protein
MVRQEIGGESHTNLNAGSNPATSTMEHPNAKKHFYVSILKSLVRIGGYALIPFNIVAACITLITSELIGIYEEMV